MVRLKAAADRPDPAGTRHSPAGRRACAKGCPIAARQDKLTGNVAAMLGLASLCRCPRVLGPTQRRGITARSVGPPCPVLCCGASRRGDGSCNLFRMDVRISKKVPLTLERDGFAGSWAASGLCRTAGGVVRVASRPSQAQERRNGRRRAATTICAKGTTDAR